MKGIWIVTTILCCVAALQLLFALFGPGLSAIQETALAGLACGTAVVPYVFCRAVEALSLAAPALEMTVSRTEDSSQEAWASVQPGDTVQIRFENGRANFENVYGLLGHGSAVAAKIAWASNAKGTPLTGKIAAVRAGEILTVHCRGRQ
jgi:hypothetical protein